MKSLHMIVNKTNKYNFFNKFHEIGKKKKKKRETDFHPRGYGNLTEILTYQKI